MKLLPFLPILAALVAAFFSTPVSAQGVGNGSTYTNSNGAVTFTVSDDGQGGVWVRATDSSGTSHAVAGQGSGDNCTSAHGIVTPGGKGYNISTDSTGRTTAKSRKAGKKSAGSWRALRFVKKKNLKQRQGNRQTILPNEDIGTLPGTKGKGPIYIPMPSRHGSGFAPFPF